MSDQSQMGRESRAAGEQPSAGGEHLSAVGNQPSNDKGAPGRPRPAARNPQQRRIEQRLTVVPPRTPARQGNPEWPERVLVPPPGQRRRSYGEYISFTIAVVLPVLVASIYYGFISSDQYLAEFRFAVKDTTQSASVSGTSITSILGGSAGSAPLENYIVADYLLSRQAIEELQQRINVKSLYAKSDVDWWARFDASRPMEKFLSYWQSMVRSNYDVVTGIATAEVRAFTPQDALLIANSLVTLSEELINKIANRASTDAVRFAQGEVERAENRLKKVRAQLTAYRNRVGVIDPTSSVVASNSTVQQSLQASLATLETQLASLIGRNLSSTSPAVQTLQNQIKATKDQLAVIGSSVATGQDRAGGVALSTIIAEFEQLDLERQFAQNVVNGAMQALEQARANAAAQHLYITPYVRPSLPDSSTYPRRFISVLVIGLIAFGLWTISLLTVRSIRERFS